MPKKPVRQVEQWDYVLEDERDLPLDQQGVFTLAPLTMDERARARDERTRLSPRADGAGMTTEPRMNQWALGLVLTHLVKVERVPSDAPARWPGLDRSREERLAWLETNLDDTTVLLLGMEIFERSVVGPAVKN